MLLTSNNNLISAEYDLQLSGLSKNAGKTQKGVCSTSPASVAPQLTARVIQACREDLKTADEDHERTLDKQVF
jgi:hypothetical protein